MQMGINDKNKSIINNLNKQIQQEEENEEDF